MLEFLLALVLLWILALRCRRNRPGLEDLRGWSYAHRGLHGPGAPENSMAAFRAALDGGFGVELDVHLLKDGKTMVQPDILVLCDISKLTEKRIEGAPDFVAEILSPSTRRKDMTLKLSKYTEAGVREYWIIDHKEKKVIVYDIENDALPQIYGFRDKVPVAIFDGRCQVDFAEIDDTLEFYFGDKE